MELQALVLLPVLFLVPMLVPVLDVVLALVPVVALVLERAQRQHKHQH